jgi:hypothetical protein
MIVIDESTVIQMKEGETNPKYLIFSSVYCGFSDIVFPN